MREVIKILFCILLAIVFVNIGYPFYTWQFWAFGIPLLILYKIIEFKFFPPKKSNE